MTPSLIKPEDFDRHKEFLGNKTLNLKKCLDWGFNVPKFMALPSAVSAELWQNQAFRAEAAREITRVLPCQKYAVRSSALIEDGGSRSLAGQFLSKTNVSGPELSQGIYELLKQADAYLKGDLAKFSIIVQEYIAVDIFGVTFTRNPDGNREMVIEYGFCAGEDIVSGKIKPNKISLYWNQPASVLPKSVFQADIVPKFKDLESRYGFPQDIEWGLKDGQFYLLQTRPITTISPSQYEQIKYLESVLPRNQNYYFEKTEIAEIAPRPSTVSQDLLKLVYANGGPVANIYRKFGVEYRDTDCLKIIGNELFVDKEKEIQGLLPAYSYLRSQEFTPKIHGVSKLLPTIKNVFYLNKINTAGHEELFFSLKNRLKSDNSFSNLSAALSNFLSDYELIFETNLLSGLSVKKCSRILQIESVNFPEIVSSASLFIDESHYQVSPPNGLTGNSLEVSDESVFISHAKPSDSPNPKIVSWWHNVPSYKKKLWQKQIAEAIIYNRLRELGRWLTVKNICLIKSALIGQANIKGFNDPKNIYFAQLENILHDKLNESVCVKHRMAYERYRQYALPNRLTSRFVDKAAQTVGVSSGVASGVLINQAMLDGGQYAGKPIILYTEMLLPQLTHYFSHISGIVSHNGGMLSHLAIMARENKIPAIVGFSMTGGRIKLGDNVQIDGDSGTVTKID